MLRSIAALAMVFALLLAGPAAAAGSSSSKVRELRVQLRKERAAHERTKRSARAARSARDRALVVRDDATEARDAARVTISTLNGRVSSLQTELAAAQGSAATAVQQRDTVAAENAQLRGAVPAQVAAIAATGNASQLQSLVLLPAYNAWACRGSIFYGETFFSFDFDRRDSDGTCY